MFFNKKILIFMLSLASFFTNYSQNKNTEKSIPTSIYKFTPEAINANSTVSINQKLNLTSYKFLLIDTRNIAEGYYSVPFCNLNKYSTDYIYDTYDKIYHNPILSKGHFKVADLYKVRPINKK